MPNMLFARFKWHTKENATELHPVQFKLILGLQRGFLTQCFRRNWLKEQRDILNCKTFLTTCISLKIKILLPADLTLRRFCCTVLWQSSSSSKKELGILVVGWKWLFWCKIHFRTHRIIIWDQKNTPKKFSQKTDREVGVNAYGQPKISVFLTPSLKRYSEAKQ